MGLLSGDEIRNALIRLGAIAEARGIPRVKLVVAGGAVMVLRYDARPSTKDVDAVFVEPELAATVRDLAKQVAAELAWPDDWLNDGVKGYLGDDPEEGETLLEAPGISVVAALTEQMLAMKLSAFRDKVDRADAMRLLRELSGTSEEVWFRVERYLLAHETKARYAFEEIWQEVHGDD
jgi:hypothetical protein